MRARVVVLTTKLSQLLVPLTHFVHASCCVGDYMQSTELSDYEVPHLAGCPRIKCLWSLELAVHMRKREELCQGIAERSREALWYAPL